MTQKTIYITGLVIDHRSSSGVEGLRIEAWDKDLLFDDLVGSTVALRVEGYQTMNKHNLFYYPCASFTHAQLWLLKMAALCFDKLYLLDPVGASRSTIGTDYDACEVVRQLNDAGILQKVMLEEGLAKRTGPIANAIHRDLQEISNYE